MTTSHFNRPVALLTLMGLIIVFVGITSLIVIILFNNASLTSDSIETLDRIDMEQVGSSGDETLANYTGIPIFTIESVVENESVTIQTINFPPDQFFTVTMGRMFTQGVGGVIVGSFYSGSGGEFQQTFTIPDALTGEGRIAIRAQTQEEPCCYYAYNWFWNSGRPFIKWQVPQTIISGQSNVVRLSLVNPALPGISTYYTETVQVDSGINQIFASPMIVGTPSASLVNVFGEGYIACVSVQMEGVAFNSVQIPTRCQPIEQNIRQSDLQWEWSIMPKSDIEGPQFLITRIDVE